VCARVRRVKRDLVSKETYRVKRDLQIQKRPIESKETYWSGKTGLLTLAYLRYAEVSKETYSYGKRDLFIWQKRPITMSIPQQCNRSSRASTRDLVRHSKETCWFQKRPSTAS